MDQRHRPQYPNSGQQSIYKRHTDSDRSQHENKRLRPNHPSPAPSTSSSPTLSTKKELYERDFPVYKQPVEVGSFSLDSERRFFNDARKLRYYVEPHRSPNFDLRDGYKDRFIKRDDGIKEKLDHILRWIQANRSKLQSKQPTSSSSW